MQTKVRTCSAATDCWSSVSSATIAVGCDDDVADDADAPRVGVEPDAPLLPADNVVGLFEPAVFDCVIAEASMLANDETISPPPPLLAPPAAAPPTTLL